MISLETTAGCFNFRTVGVAIQNEQVLLHRAVHDTWWSLPGGRVELHEPSAEALVREMREEMGVEILVLRLLSVNEHFYVDDVSLRRHHSLGLYYLMQVPQTLFPERTPSFTSPESNDTPLQRVWQSAEGTRCGEMSKIEEDYFGSADYAVHDGLQMPARFRQRMEAVDARTNHHDGLALQQSLRRCHRMGGRPGARARNSHGVLALCIHVPEGPVHHHMARCGGARAWRRFHLRNLLACFLNTPPVPASYLVWCINLPMYCSRCIVLDVLF
jgi:8-oxo-dGTP pyrophosphatase MutT (NUDIX family)